MKKKEIKKTLYETQLIREIAELVIRNSSYGQNLFEEKEVLELFPELTEIGVYLLNYNEASYLEDIYQKINTIPDSETKAIFNLAYDSHLLENDLPRKTLANR